MASDRDRGPLPAAGERLELEITDLSSRGLGVGRSADGLVVMVRDAAPGDRVAARLSRVHRSWAEADVEALLLPSPDRVAPRCAHFGVCGGCALQHLAPAAQRRLKAARLRRLVARAAGPIPVEEARMVGPDYGYRNRMEFGCADGPEGLRIGLHDRNGQLFDLRECHLPHPAFARLVAGLRQAAAALPGPTGLRRVEIRRAERDGAVLLGVTASGPPSPELAAALAGLPALAGGPLSAVVLWPGGREVVAGRGELRERLGEGEVEVAPGAFVQTHTAGAAALYREALAWLEPLAGGPLLDLYSGPGALALQAAGRFAPVLAVEVSAGGVAAGRRAAADGPPVRFWRQEAGRAVARLVAAGERFPAAVVNPPRAGLAKELPAGLARLGVRRLAYISCDPGTLARDLGRLAGRGLAPVSVTPFDLFPQTAGIEAVARLGALDGVDGTFPGR